ncbi:MAG: cupredoxin domain-containing protein [Actinomycetota bacterium]|nr:cupredoxin domain-containing protein [Actinomycetota bacterium]MDH5223427.1 cupredoxin domain-containing protein [Actinomycetota bacterium]MDH5312240.1 cupredoxin domain-containing protein [Actinomycetota bacterium]
MRIRERRGIWIALAAASLLLAAVSVQVRSAEAHRDEGGGASVREIRIEMHHSAFEPDHVEVEPGDTVRFVLVNTDPIDHEFIVGDTGVQLAHERGTEAHHRRKPGEMTVPALTTRSTIVAVPEAPGSTLFACHLPGHFAYGMAGSIMFD